ncbi:MAG: hypothetical protein KFH87_13875 [Bacteroidetes bacterium]|nr:hypothetical protein [Bacteroidota bacterium]
MSRNTWSAFSMLLISAVLLFAACSESGSPNDPNDTDVQRVFTSGGEGTLSDATGAEVQVHVGAISNAGDGSNAEVSFSIKTNVDPGSVPTAIPATYELIGDIRLFEPANFVFTDPVQLFLPASEAETPEDLTVLWYDSGSKKWIPLPLNALDEENRRLGVSAFQLGYFAVARVSPAAAGKKASSDRVGGLRYSHNHTSNYYYTLTIADVTYANPSIGWPNLVGYSASTGSRPTGGPLTATHLGNIPQGSYTVYISRVKRGTLSSPPGDRETYSVPTVKTVGPFTSIGGWSMKNWSGWSDISPAGGGQWRKGTPDTWPNPTIPPSAGADPLNGKWHLSIQYTTPPYEQQAADIDLRVKSSSVVHLSVYDEDDAIWQSLDIGLERSADKRNVKLIGPEEDGEFWVMTFTFMDAGMSRFEGKFVERWYDYDDNGNKIWIDEEADIVGTRKSGIVAPPGAGNGSLSKQSGTSEGVGLLPSLQRRMR